MPWSFVAHNQSWNIIPTTQSVNSSKSDNLPSEEYFHDFVELQHCGLTVGYANISRNEWLKYTESFVFDLKVGQAEDLLCLSVLRKAYEITTLPLISLATVQGFSPNWVYNRETMNRH
ncbi:hypothetical protein [Fischerella sp. NIES-3754]|uniref:hypothetical protein n=1 Tax=Fischerella sp. NIES-3754 TaxID=1752063 RepID=UPI001E513B8A|nr:hypothetical protein [Fischerella sp. NIES-3754]